MRFVVFPLFARLLQYVNEHVQLAGADVTLVLVFTFLSAATTEAIGIHAVFGAFARRPTICVTWGLAAARSAPASRSRRNIRP